MAFLNAILVSGKGPHGAAAADTQACVGTVLRHIGSCRTLVTGKHLAGDTVDMVVFANETWGLLFRLSPGGTEESKLKERKSRWGDKNQEGVTREEEEKGWKSPNPTIIIPMTGLSRSVPF